ncbi:restriction endonuclease subunit S [Ligilactobacillus salivarius]|uniref:Restriction endonuclease subunit S n=3 Tax=Ligilactobacillus salivarius TaxID=1624 RepID=A0AAW7N6X0_9LACO|nr:restriction endonuclease subunit S [Ligilactobacillus salivarius]MDN4833383.1 restriction endonuclease subunit S [Ligilactobacillus salivarius]
MAKEEKKAPKLRFNGYTNDWEQVKLEKLATFSKGKGYSKLDLKRKGYPIFLYGQMYTDYRYKIVETSTYASLKEDAVVSNGNEIVIPSSGETSVDIARASWIAQKGIILGSDLNIIRPTSSVHPLFLALSLSNNQVKYNLAKVAQGNSIVHLYNNNLKKVNIYFPNIVEQNKIGNILNSISNCINLHERKCEELTLIKKALLQKFFPKKDEVTPEVRYKSFSDDWEQRKFGDLYKKVSEKNDGTYGADKVISVANMYYKSDVKISGKNYLKTYNIFKVGDIAFEGNKSKHFAHGRFVENTIGDGIVSHVFDVFRPTMSKYDLQYWSYLINNENVMGKILIKSTNASTMMTNLVSKDFLKQNIIVPNSYEEEKKIGKFLNEFDSLIALHQRKLEKLKQLKKFLLQNMFI